MFACVRLASCKANDWRHWYGGKTFDKETNRNEMDSNGCQMHYYHFIFTACVRLQLIVRQYQPLAPGSSEEWERERFDFDETSIECARHLKEKRMRWLCEWILLSVAAARLSILQSRVCHSVMYSNERKSRSVAAPLPAPATFPFNAWTKFVHFERPRNGIEQNNSPHYLIKVRGVSTGAAHGTAGKVCPGGVFLEGRRTILSSSQCKTLQSNTNRQMSGIQVARLISTKSMAVKKIYEHSMVRNERSIFFSSHAQFRYIKCVPRVRIFVFRWTCGGLRTTVSFHATHALRLPSASMWLRRVSYWFASEGVLQFRYKQPVSAWRGAVSFVCLQFSVRRVGIVLLRAVFPDFRTDFDAYDVNDATNVRATQTTCANFMYVCSFLLQLVCRQQDGKRKMKSLGLARWGYNNAPCAETWDTAVFERETDRCWSAATKTEFNEKIKKMKIKDENNRLSWTIHFRRKHTTQRAFLQLFLLLILCRFVPSIAGLVSIHYFICVLRAILPFFAIVSLRDPHR